MFKYGSEVGGINLLYSVLKLIMSPDIAPKMVQYMKRNGGVASRLRGLCIRNTKIHSYFKPTKYGLRLHEKANELWTSESDGSMIPNNIYTTSESDGSIDTKQYTACPQPILGITTTILLRTWQSLDNPRGILWTVGLACVWNWEQSDSPPAERIRGCSPMQPHLHQVYKLLLPSMSNLPTLS